MLNPHDLAKGRIVFVNRDIFWADINMGNSNNIIFHKDAMVSIFTGELITAFNHPGVNFTYILTSSSPYAGQWLMNLEWLDVTPSSQSNSIYNIHHIMEHVNDLERMLAHTTDSLRRHTDITITRLRAFAALKYDPYDIDQVGLGLVCPKCFMEWSEHIPEGHCPENNYRNDWYGRYRSYLIEQYKYAVVTNEFHDGFDENDWTSRELSISLRLGSLDLTKNEIDFIKKSSIEDYLKNMSAEDVEDYLENNFISKDSYDNSESAGGGSIKKIEDQDQSNPKTDTESEGDIY